MPILRAHLTWFTLAIALTSALGCKGCDQGGQAPPATEHREAQPENAQLRARLDARKLDRGKVYPKAADGSITCSADKSCFILQVEACNKVTLAYTQDMSGFGLLQRVDFLYRIEGKEAGKCKVTRRVTALGVELSKPLIEMLHQKGKTDGDVQVMKDDADDSLRANNPTMLECWFGQEVLLEAALDFADNKYKPQVWHDACREVTANVPPPEDAFKPAGGN